MSREHPWLRFVAGPVGEQDQRGGWRRLDDDARPWQEAVVELNAQWYPGLEAPQVAAATVLQYLLQVPAQTLAYAVRLAATGQAGVSPATPPPTNPAPGRFRHLPSSVDAETLRIEGLAWVPDPAELAFTLGEAHTPDTIRLGRFLPLDPEPTPREFAPGPLQARPGANSRNTDVLAEAEQAYRAVAEGLATAYPSIVPMGSRTRLGMVTDIWAAAATGGVVERESCCFIYALPGCRECAGCPRLRPPAR